MYQKTVFFFFIICKGDGIIIFIERFCPSNYGLWKALMEFCKTLPVGSSESISIEANKFIS